MANVTKETCKVGARVRVPKGWFMTDNSTVGLNREAVIESGPGTELMLSHTDGKTSFATDLNEGGVALLECELLAEAPSDWSKSITIHIPKPAFFGAPIPAQHPSDAKRTATCILASSRLRACGDAGALKGIGDFYEAGKAGKMFGLCGVHALEREKELGSRTRELQESNVNLRPKRPIEPYEGLHQGLQVACLPKGVNPEGWEARKPAR